MKTEAAIEVSTEDVKTEEEEFGECVIASSVTGNTYKKCLWMVDTFRKWYDVKKDQWTRPSNSDPALMEIKNLEDMSKADLNYVLKLFVLEIRMQNGQRYSSSTLRDFFSMIQYYVVNVCEKPWSLWKDSEFIESRRALNAAMKLSIRDGKGSGLRKEEPFPSSIEDMLWSTGTLGDDSPRQLCNTLIWCVGKHFSLRGGSELRDLKYNKQIRLEVVGNEECLAYSGNSGVKSNKGSLKREPKILRAFHTEGHVRCIVCLYTNYVSRRPTECSDALFLSCNRQWKPDGLSEWYTHTPMGRHMLADTVKSLVKEVAPDVNIGCISQSLPKISTTAVGQDGSQRADVKCVAGHSSTDTDCSISILLPKRTQHSSTMTGVQSTGPTSVCISSAYSACLIPSGSEDQTDQIVGEGTSIMLQTTAKKMRIDLCSNANKVSITFE